MSDPTGGSIAQITTDMLKRVAMARGPQAVAQVVSDIARTLGTGTGPVIRGIAASLGSVASGTAGWAGTATTAVQGAMDAGVLVSSEAAVTGAAGAGAAGAAGAATTGAGATGASGGMFAWFTGLGVAAQVAVVVGAVVLTAAVAQGVGSLSGDDPSAIPGSGPVTTLESGPAISGFQDGYKAVGVQFDGEIGIVSVRGTVALQDGIAPCRFRHGGVNCEDDADIVDLDSTIYGTAAEATEALCNLLDGPRFSPALADGWSVPYGGRTVTLDDWGSVDLDLCDEIIGT
jgi:hypothetical protein